MGRLHLFEWEDFPWFPATMRGYMTDYLREVGERLRMFDPLAPRIAEVMRRMGTTRIVDLCSGSAGTLATLLPAIEESLGARVSGVLTDLYPNPVAFGVAAARTGGRLSWIEEPVDACAVPTAEEGLRTLFLGFHHLSEDIARSVLQDAVRHRRAIGIFEATERSFFGVMGPLTAPLALYLLTPFMRPFRIGRLFWTYGIPAIPFFSAWDGVVSALRTYSPDELRALVGQVEGSEAYTWDIGQSRIPRTPAHVTWLFGWPTDAG